MPTNPHAKRHDNGPRTLRPASASFNRPPRLCPQLPTDTVRIPSLPSAYRQGRVWSIVSSLLTSAALIGGSLLVNRNTGGSLVYLVPMVAGAAVFLLISVVQLIHDYWRRWRQSIIYTAQLRAITLRMVQLYTDQQFIRYMLDPELTVEQSAERAARCDHEQADLLKQFFPRTLHQRLTRTAPTPSQFGLQSFSDRWASAQPSVVSLLDIAGCDSKDRRKIPRPRLWERRPNNPDFLVLRLGVSEQPSSIKVEVPQSTECPPHIDALIERFAAVRDVPLTFTLPKLGSLGLAGPQQQVINLAHGLLWQIIIHHAPSEVRIAAIYNPSQSEAWAWLRWLPHTLPLNGDRRRRMIAVSESRIEQLLIGLLDELSRRRDQSEGSYRPPQIILLVDDEERLHRSTTIQELLRRGSDYGINLIVLVDTWEDVPSDCGASVRIDANGVGAVAIAGGEWSPACPLVQADSDASVQLGETLAPFVLAEMGGSREIPRNVRLLDLLRSRCNGEFDPLQLWRHDLSEAWHADVPIGQAEGGELVYLDLRQFYDGPHGIIAGKTGAGKSELLQVIIAALAATHRPDRAQFMLIDFKGGAALRDFSELPHTVGLVTDLQDSRLAERAIIAMKSELRRRKDQLNQKKVPDITEYRKLQPEPEPLANLLIVIDEFDTMVKEQPGFVSELITVVKQGRSLGVHLLVASQEPSSAVKDEIKRQLQYWIALRLGSAQDSREMLERPDAFYLPSDIPGRAYKRVGTQIKLFQAPRVSGLFQSLDNGNMNMITPLDPLTGEPLQEQQEVGPVIMDEDKRPLTDLKFIVREIRKAGGTSARGQIWCPPLPARLTLTQQIGLPTDYQQVLPAAVEKRAYEEYWLSNPPGEHLAVPIGLLDVPQESRQEIAHLNLGAGHVLVLGAPGSGKTMLLRTLLLALGMSYGPADAWCYVIDAGGQGLSAFEDMPHLGGLVRVRDADHVRRVIWIVHSILEEREQAHRVAGQQKEGGTSASSQYQPPAVLLVIDKFALFHEEYQDTGLLEDLIALAAQGRAFDIHLIITADRPGDVLYKLRGLFETRLLLRLTDESDSLALMSQRSASQIPLNQPGRGYIFVVEQGWLEFQTALPYVETAVELETMGKKLSPEAINNLLDGEINKKTRDWMHVMRERWRQPLEYQATTPPKVSLLPEKLAFAELWEEAKNLPSERDGLEVLVGKEGQTLRPARFTLKEASASFVVVGSYQTGKTTALRTMVCSLALRYQPDEVTFVLVDPRRSSFRDLPVQPHQPLYATTEAHLTDLAERLDRAIEDDTSTQRWVICIDDYDVGLSHYTVQFQKPFSGQRTFMVVLEKLANLGRERGFYLLFGANTSNPNPNQLLGQICSGRGGLILQPHNYPPISNLFGVRLPIPLSGSKPLPGRGLMVVSNLVQWVQVASEMPTESPRADTVAGPHS